jgi:23S rRNA pseudouridine1911/1915/1917 synthase
VHLAYLGHPLLGDAVYGKSPSAEGLARQFLHAFHLAFTHPVTGQALDFRAPLPADLQGVLEQLGSRYAALPVG